MVLYNGKELNNQHPVWTVVSSSLPFHLSALDFLLNVREVSFDSCETKTHRYTWLGCHMAERFKNRITIKPLHIVPWRSCEVFEVFLAKFLFSVEKVLIISIPLFYISVGNGSLYKISDGVDRGNWFNRVSIYGICCRNFIFEVPMIFSLLLLCYLFMLC